MTSIAGVDPRTGTALPAVAESTTTSEVDRIVSAAAQLAPTFEGYGRERRAALLDVMADAIESDRDELVTTAATETGFGTAKLNGELTRAAYQFRFFGEVLREGGYLEATIDTAGDTPTGPRPDLRRLLVPVGATAVFGASNFPFAFSVLGGDTASALASGCPVIVKAHESHPATSKLSYEVLSRAAIDAGVPTEILGIVYGREAGSELVAHPDIKAVGFTGSYRGGKALLDIINNRPEPIPFYGELSSINPVIVTPGAAAERAEAIATGLVASFTMGAGQLCTKPGIVLLPDNDAGQELITAVRDALGPVDAQPLLNEAIHSSYISETETLRSNPTLTTIEGRADSTTGFFVSPVVFEAEIADFRGDLVNEIFGPVTVLVRYPADQIEKAVTDAFTVLPRSLTATIHHHVDDTDLVNRLTEIALPNAGRLIYNGFPTGVAVSWAQNHGGPWPSTNSLHTSVGATAIRRFLRPITYQDAPATVLPAELQDGYAAIPRRIDGVLSLPD